MTLIDETCFLERRQIEELTGYKYQIYGTLTEGRLTLVQEPDDRIELVCNWGHWVAAWYDEPNSRWMAVAFNQPDGIVTGPDPISLFARGAHLERTALAALKTLLSWMGGKMTRDGVEILGEAQIKLLQKIRDAEPEPVPFGAVDWRYHPRLYHAGMVAKNMEGFVLSPKGRLALEKAEANNERG